MFIRRKQNLVGHVDNEAGVSEVNYIRHQLENVLSREVFHPELVESVLEENCQDIYLSPIRV